VDAFTTITGVDRCTLRRDILRDLGDLLLLVATKDGDANIFIDEVNLNAEVGGYIGREAYFCGTNVPTANAGQTRYVADSSRAQHAIAFEAALPAPTLAGDECELVNLRGVGFHAHSVNEALNESIRFAQRHSLFAVSQAVVDADPASGLFPIPPDYRTIEHVAYSDWNGRLSPLVRTDNRANTGYLVDPANRTIELGGGIAGGYYGSGYYYTSAPTQVRIDGLVEPQLLHEDHDLTKIDAEWIVYQTEANLARAKFLRSPTPESQAVMGMLQNQANALREQLSARRSPWSVDLANAAVVMVMS
jgi:hypothetical protein